MRLSHVWVPPEQDRRHAKPPRHIDHFEEPFGGVLTRRIADPPVGQDAGLARLAIGRGEMAYVRVKMIERRGGHHTPPPNAPPPASSGRGSTGGTPAIATAARSPRRGRAS